MAAITASMVAELRAKTDAPMMECKKALTEAEGDMARAEEILRVKLGNRAGKAASRITAEGVVAASVQGDTGANVTGALLGIAAIATLGNVALWVIAGILLGLNLASERISFSKVIDRTAPLRFVDRLGRPAP